jgi:hypothetical protein
MLRRRDQIEVIVADNLLDRSHYDVATAHGRGGNGQKRPRLRAAAARALRLARFFVSSTPILLCIRRLSTQSSDDENRPLCLGRYRRAFGKKSLP